MALSPYEARAKALPTEEKLLELEAVIDDHIVTAYKNGHSDTVTLQYATHFPSPHVYDILCQRYIARGWHVKHVIDQRDGDFVQFTPVTETNP